MKYRYLFILILFFALSLRLFGINWDQNQHLHPDERFLTMVATALTVPASVGDYLDPTVSTLNPYNAGDFNFFVYGTLPVTLTKVLAGFTGMDSYNGIVLVGRFLSTVADMGTMIFVYLIARLIQKRYQQHKSFPYLAAFLYGITVLAIQHAHFFTTDAFATFWGLGAVYFALKFYSEKGFQNTFASAVFFGCALGTKISSIFIAPLIAALMVCGVAASWKDLRKGVRKNFHIKANVIPGDLATLLVHGLLYGCVAYVMLRISDPRFFATASWLDLSINPQFLGNIKELQHLTSPDTIFPPSIQWLSKKPLLFPLQNMIFFGLGLPYFIAVLVGVYLTIRKKHVELLVVLVWMVSFFLYQGTRFVTTMRYFYMMYPFLALFAAYALSWPFQTTRAQAWKVYVIPVLFTLMIWPMSFMHIYTQPHPYVQASEWIYEHIPEGANLVQEHWNDYLPLNFPDPEGSEGSHQARFANRYTISEVPAFHRDTSHKQAQIKQTLAEGDYYILANNRSYGSIDEVPERFPVMSAFYTDLFEGRLGYEKVAEFTSYPTVELGFTRFVINDQWAEEAFSVYDHPRVIIMKKNSRNDESSGLDSLH